MTKNPSTDNDEIDLINVFKTSWEGKFSIIFFILIANLFVYSYINMKDPIYESKLSIEIENIPPFFDSDMDRNVGISKTFFEFTDNFNSKTNFENWKSNSKNSILSFDNISKTDVINGYQFTNEDRLLAVLSQETKKPNKANLIIKTNNLSILNDYYNYSIYINKILEKKYTTRLEDELNMIKTKYSDAQKYGSVIDRILPIEWFVTNIRMGQGVIKVYPPSIPKKIGPKKSVVFGISSVLGLIIGLLFVFIRKFFHGVKI